MSEITCSTTCQKATSYRCRCSCGGASHAALSAIPMRRTTPSLSRDMAPDPRHWTRAKDEYKVVTLPLPLDIPEFRQMSFTDIAAIWSEPERAA